MDFVGLLGLILWPVFTGFLFALIVGGSLFLGLKIFEKIMLYVINPIIAEIRDIPYIGKLLCFLITTVIGLPLLICYIIFVFVPVLCIIVHAITFGAV